MMKPMLLVLSICLHNTLLLHSQAQETEVPKGYSRVVLEAVPLEETELTPVKMDQTKEVLKRRIPKGRLPGFLSPKTLVKRLGENEFEVLVKSTDQKVVEKTVQQLIRPGTLEFAILANQQLHADLVQEARKLDHKETKLLKNGEVIAAWFSPATDAKGEPTDIGKYGNIVTRVLPADKSAEKPERLEYLIVFEKPQARIDGRYLKKVKAIDEPNTGSPAIAFTFTDDGGRRMEMLSRKHQPKIDGTAYRLAILMEGRIYSAPVLRGVIGSKGQITGHFTKEEVAEYVTLFNSGALPVRLKLKSITIPE